MREITITENMSIKDSGQRTEFSTGAVRDMHEGKGRMDLLPLTAIIVNSKRLVIARLYDNFSFSFNR